MPGGFLIDRNLNKPVNLLARELWYADLEWLDYFVSAAGIEPATHGLKGRCSTYWAMHPSKSDKITIVSANVKESI